MIQHRGNRACNMPLRDEVQMPPREQFIGAGEYCLTVFHELFHPIGHESRLKRAEIAKPSGFGTDPHAREELVAEMRATFLCGRARIEQGTLANTAAYIQNWIGKLRSDPKLVVLAAASAHRAADLVLAENQGDRESTEAAIVNVAVARTPCARHLDEKLGIRGRK